MATRNEEMEENGNYLSILTNSLTQKIKNSLSGNKFDTFSIVKRNKKLKEGDFTIIQPTPENGTYDTTSNIAEKISSLLSDLSEVALTTRDDAAVTDVNCDHKGSLSLKLNRPQVFYIILKEVFDRGTEFGKLNGALTKRAIVNIAFLHSLQADYPGEVTVSHMRSFLLSQHIEALLRDTGYTIQSLHYNNVPNKFKDFCEIFGIHFKLFDSSSKEYITVKDKLRHSSKGNSYKYEFFNGANTHPHRLGTNGIRHLTNQSESESRDESRRGSPHGENPVVVSSGDQAEGGGEEEEEESESLLHLRAYIEDEKLPFGRDGYDFNISIADFSGETERFKQISNLEYNVKNVLSIEPALCVHVAPYEQMFAQQQVDLGWKILSDTAGTIHQVHIASGPVSPRKSSHADLLPLAETFISLRREQMREAFRMKYGTQVQGEGWESTIESLTIAAIKFEFLTTNNRSPLKLDVSEDFGGLMDRKGGVFVMYNCARLSTLFYNLDTAIARETYPALPPMDNVDFSRLKEEEEWELLFNYILPYPSVLASCVASLSSGKPRSQIHAHKICQFLLELSRDFSSYYNRVHVLGEARPHLLQTMYARVYLLKAVEQVMHNALSLLGIQPLTQL